MRETLDARNRSIKQVVHRFTANRKKSDSKGKKILGHTYEYPLMELNMDREECLDMLDHLGWDYRGDGSPVRRFLYVVSFLERMGN